jgi:hypothetical protein
MDLNTAQAEAPTLENQRVTTVLAIKATQARLLIPQKGSGNGCS